MRNALFVLIAIFFGGSLPASAQYHPERGYDAMKKGTVFVYKRVSGPTSTIRFVGKRRGLFVFEAHTIDGQNTNYERTIYRNAKGQTVRFERADGAKLRYEPHNCWLVAGQCNYEFYDRNGVPGRYRTSGKFTNRGYVQTTDYLNGSNWEPVVKLRVTFDENGLETSRRIQEGTKRSRYDLKKVISPK
jgi:hypothetical protein